MNVNYLCVFYLIWILVSQCGRIHLESAKTIVVHLSMVCQCQ